MTVHITLKTIASLIFLTIAAPAQSNLDRLLAEGLRKAVAGLTPVPEKDRAEVVTAMGSRQNLEWTDLTIKMIKMDSLTEADKLNGFTKRYRAILGSTASRRWDTKANAWTAWGPTGHPLFPSGIVVEWKNGTRTARGNDYLPKFSPGPGPSIADASPAPAESALPPGMSRGK